ncbi:MAG: hypothetical protein AB7K78_01755, partial [Xanthobacteraceae bacterium]
PFLRVPTSGQRLAHVACTPFATEIMWRRTMAREATLRRKQAPKLTPQFDHLIGEREQWRNA